MVLQAQPETRFSNQTSAPVVDIIDERDLTRVRLLDLRAASQPGKGWRKAMRTLVAFVNDDLHHQSTPELQQDVADAHTFISMTVMPAFEEARAALEAQGRAVVLSDCGSLALMRVFTQGCTEFTAAVRTRLTPTGVVPVFETSGCHGGQLRRSVACARLNDMEGVITAHTHEVRQRHVASFVLAAHNKARID
jgi:hypothetical protein